MTSANEHEGGGPADGRSRRVLLAAIPLAGMAGALVLLAATLDVRQVVSSVASASAPWVAAGAALCLLSTLIGSLRLSLFLRAAGMRRPLRRCWSAVMAGLTLNAFLPARGGDLAKGVFLADAPGERATLLGIVLVERVFDVFMLGALGTLSAVALTEWSMAALGAALMSAPIGAFAALRFAHRTPVMRPFFERMGHGARSITARPWCAVGAGGVAALAWLNNTMILWCLLRATGASVEPLRAVGAGALAIFIGLLPVSVSGIGTRDAALAALLRGAAEPEAVVAAAMLYTVLGYWMLAAIGALTLRAELARAMRARRGRD
ncbi:MAG TPA: lysylphosphatidylglycerol synthase transmembrane domain-containing protein [Phycisphaerales bacterium]|nr:lysylphosphatidylglycerol synthase transmembrane domain-containing protein [Phycisphaerales bacterium]